MRGVGHDDFARPDWWESFRWRVDRKEQGSRRPQVSGGSGEPRRPGLASNRTRAAVRRLWEFPEPRGVIQVGAYGLGRGRFPGCQRRSAAARPTNRTAMAACSAIGLTRLSTSAASDAPATGVTESRATTSTPDGDRACGPLRVVMLELPEESGRAREKVSVRAAAVTGNSRVPSRTIEHAGRRIFGLPSRGTNRRHPVLSNLSADYAVRVGARNSGGLGRLLPFDVLSRLALSTLVAISQSSGGGRSAPFDNSVSAS